MMKQECKQDDQLVETIEWMRKRGSKGKGKTEVFYKGLQYNEEEIRSAEKKCIKEKGNQDANDGRFTSLRI